MKIVILILAIFVLASCSTNPIEGEWLAENKKLGSKYMLRISSGSDCLIYAGGPIDGMASECKYESTGTNAYRFWFVGENGEVEQDIFFPFTHNKEKDIISMSNENGTIELRKKQ